MLIFILILSTYLSWNKKNRLESKFFSGISTFHTITVTKINIRLWIPIEFWEKTRYILFSGLFYKTGLGSESLKKRLEKQRSIQQLFTACRRFEIFTTAVYYYSPYGWLQRYWRTVEATRISWFCDKIGKHSLLNSQLIVF